MDRFLLGPGGRVMEGEFWLGREDFLPRLPGKLRGLTEADPDVDHDHATISRQHTLISLDPSGQGVYVEDFLSEFGTFLNAKEHRVIDRTLIPWDKLTCTTLLLGWECFCMRFVRITEAVITKRGKELRRSILSKYEIYQMVFGHRGCTAPRAFFQVVLSDDNREEHEHTIVPGAIRASAVDKEVPSFPRLLGQE